MSTTRIDTRLSMYAPVIMALSVTLATGCLNPGAERAVLDEQVGKGQTAHTRWEVIDGLATFRALEPGRAVVWAQAPAWQVTIEVGADAPRQWELVARNALADSVLTADAAAALITPLPAERPIWPRWQLTLPPGAQQLTLTLAPPDLDDTSAFHVGVLSDVQEAIEGSTDIFARMNEDPELRFVVSSGDLTSQGTREELLEFQEKLQALDVPFYSTLGNHELGAPPEPWAELFGRSSFQFTFHGARFTFIDSGNGSISPDVYPLLERWLDAGQDNVHLFFTHYAPIDPIGHRNGSFRSRREAGKLLAMLARGEVDASFYGHVHSYYAFANGGHPAYISGGGGAIEERMEGVSRHYLKVEIDPTRDVREVALIRVD